MNNIETLVHVEVEERLKELSGLDATTEECKATSDLTLKLVDRYVKMAEIENQAMVASLKEKELDLQAEARKTEFENQAQATRLKEKELDLQAEANALKAMELEEVKKRRWTDFAEECIKTSVPSVICLVGAVLLTAYERSDIVTSTGPKRLWDKVLRMF